MYLSAPAILRELIKHPLSLIFRTFKENQQRAITSHPNSCLELRWTTQIDGVSVRSREQSRKDQDIECVPALR